jgi:hypothetical protein
VHLRMLVEELAHRPLALAATARSAYPTSASMNGNLSCVGLEWRTNIISICYATPPPACSLPISTERPSAFKP